MSGFKVAVCSVGLGSFEKRAQKASGKRIFLVFCVLGEFCGVIFVKSLCIFAVA